MEIPLLNMPIRVFIACFVAGTLSAYLVLFLYQLIAPNQQIQPKLMPVPSPLVRPFGDNEQWILNEDLAYRIGETADYIVVPKGFVTDFASIPQPLWSLGLSPHGQYSRAAVIHDYLYWTHACTKNQADRLMLIAMKEDKVGLFDEQVVYNGVNFGGAKAWADNENERRNGLPRVIPLKYINPSNPNIHWDEYRKMLVGKGIRDPDFDKNPIYCKYGDSSDIPTLQRPVTANH
jgi:hypothetical protein